MAACGLRADLRLRHHRLELRHPRRGVVHRRDAGRHADPALPARRAAGEISHRCRTRRRLRRHHPHSARLLRGLLRLRGALAGRPSGRPPPAGSRALARRSAKAHPLRHRHCRRRDSNGVGELRSFRQRLRVRPLASVCESRQPADPAVRPLPLRVSGAEPPRRLHPAAGDPVPSTAHRLQRRRHEHLRHHAALPLSAGAQREAAPPSRAVDHHRALARGSSGRSRSPASPSTPGAQRSSTGCTDRRACQSSEPSACSRAFSSRRKMVLSRTSSRRVRAGGAAGRAPPSRSRSGGEAGPPPLPSPLTPQPEPRRPPPAAVPPTAKPPAMAACGPAPPTPIRCEFPASAGAPRPRRGCA